MILFTNPEDTGLGLTRYELKMDHPYIIQEFLDEIRERGEWGNITIDPKLGLSIRVPYAKDHGRERLGKQIRYVNVRSAVACGGFGGMDYLVYI